MHGSQISSLGSDSSPRALKLHCRPGYFRTGPAAGVTGAALPANWPVTPLHWQGAEGGCIRTEELIGLLAAGEGRVARGVPGRRFAVANATGALVSLGLLVALLPLRGDVRVAAQTLPFWLKVS